MGAAEQLYISPEEYLAMERESETKHEYFDGEVVAMAGGSFRHHRIVYNLTLITGRILQGKPCRGYGSDLKVKAGRNFYYPDLTIVCGKPISGDEKHNDILLNPSVVFEVLSPSTEGFDRGRKSLAYRNLETLGDYVLIAQDEVLVEHWVRQTDGSWNVRTLGPGQTLRLSACDVDLAVSELYVGMDDEPNV